MSIISWFAGKMSGWAGTPAAPQAYDDASTFTIRDRGGSKWPAGLSASGRTTYVSHTEARRNARAAMNDSMQARAIVERFADTVADTGLRLELTPCCEILGITPERAAEWAHDVGERFDLWARDKKQHRAGNLTWYQSQNLYQLFQHRDNDIFVRFFYSNDPGLQNPLQWEFIDPDQVRGDAYTSSWGFQLGKDGIERDANGRETGYKIWVRDTEGNFTPVTIPATDKSGRIFMLHGFRPEYAGQGRGYSRLAHAIQEFENITDFSAASIKKAINQAGFVAFIEPSEDEDAVNVFEGILTGQGAGPAAPPVSQVTPSEPVEQLYPGVTAVSRIPEATSNTPGSMVVANLTKGSTLKPFPNSAPGDKFDTFVDAFASHLSSSLSIPLEVVLMKFNQNYSASRATLLLFWRVCQIWRNEMASDYLDPCVEMWLSGEIAAGRIVAPGWSDPRLRAAWLKKNWIGTPPPDIDPAKTAKARRENIEIGVSNLEREARDLNGSSASANIEKNKSLYKGFVNAPWTQAAVAEAAPAPAGQQQARSRVDDLMDRLESFLNDHE